MAEHESIRRQGERVTDAFLNVLVLLQTMNDLSGGNGPSWPRVLGVYLQDAFDSLDAYVDTVNKQALPVLADMQRLASARR